MSYLPPVFINLNKLHISFFYILFDPAESFDLHLPIHNEHWSPKTDCCDKGKLQSPEETVVHSKGHSLKFYKYSNGLEISDLYILRTVNLKVFVVGLTSSMASTVGRSVTQPDGRIPRVTGH